MAPWVLIVLLTGCASTNLAPPRDRLYADDHPIRPPRSHSPFLAAEVIDKTFSYPLKQLLDIPRTTRSLLGRPYEAQNVDPFDGVPNSTWFTNRLGQDRMTPEQVRIGAVTTGPDTTGFWTVTGFKSAGVTPGLTIIDGRGDGYVIKIDSPDYVSMASAADVIGSRLLYAAGYNVPENTVAWLDPRRLRIDADAQLYISTADKREPLRKRRLTDAQLQRRIEALMPPGQQYLRVVASRFLQGKILGPFAYTGTRKDDPNDVIRHEHRRELRGLYIVASWMNHADMKAENSLDVYDREARHVVHYLLDFGASMGSNSTVPSNPRRGVANSFDLGDVLTRWATFGFAVHSYERQERIVTHPEVGYLDNEQFHPAHWKPMYPAAPFDHLTDRDAFWGVRIVTAFTDEHVRAAVAAGQFRDPAADSLLIHYLTERRDRIGHYWFGRLNPLDDFHIDEGQLRFADLAADRGYASASATHYEVRVRDARGTTIQQHRQNRPAVSLVDSWPDQIMVDLWPERGDKTWPPVRLYLQRVRSDWHLAGLRRL